jgi:hypothetical protein
MQMKKRYDYLVIDVNHSQKYHGEINRLFNPGINKRIDNFQISLKNS